MVKMAQITMGTGKLVVLKGEMGIIMTDHQLHIEGQSLVGGGFSKGTNNNRITPRPYIPTFLDGQPQDNHFREIEDNFEEYVREYATLSAGFKRQVTLDQYCGIKLKGRPRNSHK
jgi:hypothetical protein